MGLLHGNGAKDHRNYILSKTADCTDSRLFLFLSLDVLPILFGKLLVLVLTEFVINLVLECIGEILLFDPMVGVIVRIKIVLTLDLRSLAVEVLVLQVTGKIHSPAASDIGKGGIHSEVRTV